MEYEKILAKAFENLAKGLSRIEDRLDDILDAMAAKGPVGSLEEPSDDFTDLEKSCGDVLPVEITRVRIG